MRQHIGAFTSENNKGEKISFTNKVENNAGSYASNTHWKISYNNGSTEGGSSGAPLLNQNHRVVGQNHSGIKDCPPNAIKYFGRFDTSWGTCGSSSDRLREHLDPLNTNPSILNGKNCNLTINNMTYGSCTHVLAGFDVTISNTVINSNGVVRIHGQNSLVLNPGFEVQLGSSATLTAGPGIFTQ